MKQETAPLAARLRPKTIDEVIGQEHILGPGKLLRRVIEAKKVPSLIFYGPPGTGKTTLGFVIAAAIDAEFVYVNAAFTSTAEVKKILHTARTHREKGRKTILFIDEVHRFNKLQQETLVPDTESGGILFIGATIYNPHYYLIPSVISRSVVAQFKPLAKNHIVEVLKRGLVDKENGLGKFKVDITDKAIEYLAQMSDGDCRKALNSLEVGVLSTKPDENCRVRFDIAVAKESIQKNIFYDKKDGYHYDTISAFIKSVRGSDPDSALYWLARMLVSGEDPRFIARRLVILASEDIGNADPQGLVIAASCFNAVEFVGMPEANLILAQTTIYLACSPKSNSATLAIGKAMAQVENEQTAQVPEHIKTHSQDYQYPHNHQTNSQVGGFVAQDYGAKSRYYFPLDVGQEKQLKEFLERIEKMRKG